MSLASIYFEKVIKTAGTKLTIWDRNFQLAFHSILLFLGMVAYEALATGTQPGNGWTWLSVAVAVLGALGGVLVALSVSHFETLECSEWAHCFSYRHICELDNSSSSSCVSHLDPQNCSYVVRLYTRHLV